jgi:hypothetical protein
MMRTDYAMGAALSFQPSALSFAALALPDNLCFRFMEAEG